MTNGNALVVQIYKKYSGVSDVYSFNPNLTKPLGGIHFKFKFIDSFLNYFSPMRKNTVNQRLNIVKGQINGLMDLIENGKDCRKVTEQFYAANTALKKAMELYFKENMTTCLESINPQKKTVIEFLLKEIIKNK